MTTAEQLRQRMEAAAAAMDFEEAGRLRDQLSILRGADGGTNPEEIDTSGLRRQQPGSMGLGTSQQRMTPPPGWKRPPKPDLMTNVARSKKPKR